METIALLEKLIRFKTTSDRIPEIKKCIVFIENMLKKKGLYTKVEYLNGKPVLYACTKRTKRPDLLLVPHIDVVPADDTQFIPMRKGNRLYGRGTCDNKHNAAVIIQTLLAMAGTGASVGAQFITDEEIGGKTTQLLVKKGYVGKVNLLLDADRAIVFRQKGVCNLTVTVTGKSAHGSEPWLGENAIEKAMEVWQRIKALFPPASHKDQWKRTANLALISGGDLINKVPDRAEMQMNIRVTEKDDVQKLIARISRIKGVASVVQTGNHPFFYTSPDAPAVKTFKRVMERELKAALPLASMNGATDAHNFGHVTDPVFISGVGGGGGMHGADEWIDVRDVLKFEQALLAYAREVCG